MPDEAVIVSVGAASPVGLDSRMMAAAVRAGVARLAEIPLHNRLREPFVMGCVPDDALPPLKPELEVLKYRERRLLQLAQIAVDESLAMVADAEGPFPLALGLSELETGLPMQTEDLVKLLPVQCERRIDPNNSVVHRSGRAAGLAAIGMAVSRLEKSQAPYILAGGVDSFREPYILGTLDRDGRISSSETLDGFIPGEGAGFVLLANQESAAKNKLHILARIRGVKTGMEPGHIGAEEPFKGEGLADLLTELFEEVKPERPISAVYSSMNGENYWAKEWAVALIRNKQSFDEEIQLIHPADCYGDTGAACGGLLTCLAVRDLEEGKKSGPILIYSSSDLGERVAMILDPAA